ncbi:MAG: DUF3786 domain-containing protein [Syntrophorhabdaceae bacterium]|nr:DUF3786 domain-containing protein [Syntrophorhabdaceae bacterium]
MFDTEGFKTNYDLVYRDLFTSWVREGNKRESVRFFNEEYRITEEGILCGEKPVDTVGGILILRYLSKNVEGNLHNVWMPYRELKDGSNFARYIKDKIEDVIAKEFTGRVLSLKERLNALGGIEYPHDSRPDLSIVIYAFPDIPVISVFWDRDDEFPASFQFFYDRSAQNLLDMESLAVLLHYIHKKIT